MDLEDAAMLVLMFIVFGVPALALSARLAIRPVLQAIEGFMKALSVSPRLPDPRVEALASEVSRLTKEVERLSEAEAFDRQLRAGPSHEAKLGSDAER